MDRAHSVASEFGYLGRLMGAGLDGIASARREARGSVFVPPLRKVVWMPAAIGAAVGALTAGADQKRRSASRLTTGALVGTAVGFGAGLVWASRHFTGRAAGMAARNVSALRDAHWLERNPIDYA